MGIIKKTLKKAVRHVKPIRAICRNTCGFMKFVPPGHFYSPIPSDEDYRSARAAPSADLPGIDAREGAQTELLERIGAFYRTIPDFTFEKGPRYRYRYDNHYYSYSDATILACYLQYERPRRFVDIGGGFTTLLLLDLNDTVFKEDPVRIEVIEPHPESLRSMLRENDRLSVRAERVQEIDLAFFEELDKGDVLFLDTTHVSKLGSDVNHIMFNILPRLKRGVRIHAHEMFFPFEYPGEFFFEGKYWNELYLWRAFLTHNAEYEIELFNSYLERFDEQVMRRLFPRYFEKGRPEIVVQNQGSSLWLKKK
jgi:hypothetical protein